MKVETTWKSKIGVADVKQVLDMLDWSLLTVFSTLNTPSNSKTMISHFRPSEGGGFLRGGSNYPFCGRSHCNIFNIWLKSATPIFDFQVVSNFIFLLKFTGSFTQGILITISNPPNSFSKFPVNFDRKNEVGYHLKIENWSCRRRPSIGTVGLDSNNTV